MSGNENSILEVIENSKGYDVALLTTFNFDVSFFDQRIFRQFAKNGIRKVNVFVDTAQLNEAIKNSDSSSLGREYCISPISIKGAFHPKIILFLHHDKAKLIISSANLGTSGMTTNNEIFNSFEYEESHPEYRDLIISAVNLMKVLFSLSPIRDAEIEKYISQYSLPAYKSEGSEIILLNSTEKSILEQCKEYINEQVIKINVAVPYYDGQLTALKGLMDEFDCHNVSLYIQNKRSTFPVEYNKNNQVVSDKSICPYQSISLHKRETRFYHGKVIELVTQNNSYIVYGSANCTANALLKTMKNGGNIECDVLVKDTIGANKEFFQNFLVDKDLQLENCPADNYFFTPEYSFYYGELIGNEALLHVVYRHYNLEISVFLEKTELNYKYIDQELVINIPIGLLENVENLFEIKIVEGSDEYKVGCWLVDSTSISVYRLTEVFAKLENFTVDDDTNKYSDYMMRLLEALFNNEEWEEAEEALKKIDTYQNTAEELEEDELETEYFLSEDISDRYLENKPIFKNAYSRSLSFAARFFRSLSGFVSRQKEKGTVELSYPEPKAVSRAATSDERKLARFIRRNLKILLISEDTYSFKYEYYKNLCGVVMDIFQRLIYVEKVKDFLSIDYVMEVKYILADKLLDKAAAYENYKAEDDLIQFVLMTLVERGYRLNSGKDEISKNLILKLNNLYSLRDSYKEMLKSLKLSEIGIANLSDYDPVTYIDQLFGYKTRNQLKEYFCYGK